MTYVEERSGVMIAASCMCVGGGALFVCCVFGFGWMHTLMGHLIFCLYHMHIHASKVCHRGWVQHNLCRSQISYYHYHDSDAELMLCISNHLNPYVYPIKYCIHIGNISFYFLIVLHCLCRTQSF